MQVVLNEFGDLLRSENEGSKASNQLLHMQSYSNRIWVVFRMKEKV